MGRIALRQRVRVLPIAGFLIEAAQRGLKAKRLAMCNSGDTAGDRHRVVGYGAWVFETSLAAVYLPFTLSVMGTLSMRLRDLTISFVVAAYFLKCAVSRCDLKASALS